MKIKKFEINNDFINDLMFSLVNYDVNKFVELLKKNEKELTDWKTTILLRIKNNINL